MSTTQAVWSPEKLQEILQVELAGREVSVISNREPCIHTHRKEDFRIEMMRPASGLVTALEPVMRACKGTWIAHGSGTADKQTVDKNNRINVPPEDPSYFLRRVWLTQKHEQGYYYGFANSGLWPLCHHAYESPLFDYRDYTHYEMVNKQFARAAAAEAGGVPNPIFLVQDYHFALLPLMLRQLKPHATIVTFWHIPWPSSEIFGICPWREKLLKGLLGSDILGFHTPLYCDNFVETVVRYLPDETIVSSDKTVVTLDGNETVVRPYPISIAWPDTTEMESVSECRRKIREENGIAQKVKVGLGVDRLDYTKGIDRRLVAIEHLFAHRPGWIGKFSFIQIAAPSRSKIEAYEELGHRVRRAADSINKRFTQGRRDNWQPIILKVEHHDQQDVYEYYRGCDLLFVSSLHDGMNLVAKEFAAARDDEQGVLLLSEFTGAAEELEDALVVNPYDAEQCAFALHRALVMSTTNQGKRMRAMREQVKENNVYKWAGIMLIDAAKVRRT